METHSRIRFICASEEALERLRFYLNSETRPCFEEDVPESEQSVFEVMEFAPSPVELSGEGLVIDVLFENTDFDELSSMVKALSRWAEQCYVFFADDEEYKAFFKLAEGTLVVLYTLGDDEALDEKLYELDWDTRAMTQIQERF